MTSERSQDAADPIGFAGLTSLVSDVDGIVRKVAAGRPAAKTTSTSAGTRATVPTAPAKVYQGDGAQRSSKKGFIWAAVAIGTLWLIGVAFDESNSVTPTSSVREATSPSTAPAAAPPQLAAPPISASPVEQLPPVGTNQVLNAAQIRYCLSEDIRLEAARETLALDADIERFNSMIVDYNSRCANYRYRTNTFESVQSEVQANTRSLQIEGASRFVR